MKKLGTHRVDENLYLQVRDDGTKSWAFRYTRNGRRRSLGLGSARKVSYDKARQLAAELRLELWHGGDPAESREEAKAEQVARADVPTFAWCAEQYIEAHRSSWKNEKHIAQWESTLRMYAGPVIGKMRVDKITVDHVFKILKPIWTSKPETASRLRGRIERVLGWAAAKKYRSGENPARWQGGELVHLLPAVGNKVKHHAAVPYVELPGLMVELRNLDSISAKALRFTILTAARTGETIGALWDEVDLAAATWTIPAERMKAGVEHRVALSDEAVELLRTLDQNGKLVFPGPKDRALSNMAMLQCLRGIRGTGETVHGMRSAFSTWARDLTNHPRELIEASLAHAIGNSVEQAYSQSDYLAKRRALMADWATYLNSG